MIREEMLKDKRIVYSAYCTWWGSIYDVVLNDNLPVCPYCGSALFEMSNIGQWYHVVDKYEASGAPGYRDFIDWVRGKCFKTMKEAEDAFLLSLDDCR